MVAVGNDALWRRFAPVLGLDRLVDDPRFATNPARVEHRDQLLPVIEATLATRSADDWAKLLAAAGVPAAPINTVDQALQHPQVLARGMVAELDHPTAGRLRAVASPVKLSGHPPTVRTAPPIQGEHTDAVLGQMGYGPAAIERFRNTGVIR
jgi:formyl-CoA transferase/CoA:oxalate CoA-transferase